MVVDDTTRINVIWKTGSQVKRARGKTSMCETDQGGNDLWNR